MTPKEKAKDLVNRLKPHSYNVAVEENDELMKLYYAKQFALIAVDEMLSNNVLKHRTCGYDLITSSHVEYWNQVKNEINNL